MRARLRDAALGGSLLLSLLVACTSSHGNDGPPLTVIPNNGDFAIPEPDAGEEEPPPIPEEEDAGAAGIVVTAPAELETSEGGGTVVLSVRLARRPQADVIVPVVVSGTEATASAATVDFTAADWDVPQSLVITGKDDGAADGDVSYEVALGPAMSADLAYDGLASAPVTLVNLDDDTPGIVVKAASTTTTELGGTATINVRLASKPTASVTIPVSSSMPTEATVPFASISFDASNWSTPKAVVVTGVDDGIADGTKAYNVVFGAAVSTDASYAGKNPNDVAMTNLDRPRDGANQGNAARSCTALHTDFPALPSGAYWVDPEGGATANAFAVTCDMTLDGGGWTMLGRGAYWTATDDALPANTMLSAARLARVVAPSTNLYRLGSGASRLYIKDAAARFDVGASMWRTNGAALTCAKTYAAVQNQTMAAAGTFAVTCDPLAPGSHDCALATSGTPNGWILYSDGDTYDPSGTHPCSFGAQEAPTGKALIDLWVR